MADLVQQARVPDHPAHGPSLSLTLGIYVGLLGLTGLTVVVAYQDLGRFSALAALSIAAVKGTLVVLYFMHLRYASRLIALYAASGLLFLAILLGITMGEVAGRTADPRIDPLAPPRVTGAAEEPP